VGEEHVGLVKSKGRDMVSRIFEPLLYVCFVTFTSDLLLKLNAAAAKFCS
jgi:hypothetical protein